MAFVPVPNGIRVVLEYTKNSQLVVNVYYVTVGEPITTVNLTAVANAFLGWWGNEARLSASSALRLLNVQATDASVEDGVQVNVPVGTTIQQGARAGLTTPNNVAIVVSLRSQFTGRSRRGRNYLAWLTADDVDADNIPTTLAAQLVTRYVELQTRLSAVPAELVVASFVNNGVPRTSALTTQITGYSVNFRVDTQRRRLPGEGA